ncbi:hypothetical protein EVAR_24283_1 [Eumeta japonica]|uniref:Uncharacterized protein n=1 Tax=Eumeta variegata TaxID=151549 RepID=A0A4C1VE54_EUMVA|nr:hypothetical protein EVAR_24283_1 [Eumeta japonica]
MSRSLTHTVALITTGGAGHRSLAAFYRIRVRPCREINICVCGGATVNAIGHWVEAGRVWAGRFGAKTASPGVDRGRYPKQNQNQAIDREEIEQEEQDGEHDGHNVIGQYKRRSNLLHAHTGEAERGCEQRRPIVQRMKLCRYELQERPWCRDAITSTNIDLFKRAKLIGIENGIRIRIENGTKIRMDSVLEIGNRSSTGIRIETEARIEISSDTIDLRANEQANHQSIRASHHSHQSPPPMDTRNPE